MSSIGELLGRHAGAVAPPEQFTASEWAERYRYLTKDEGAAIPGKYRGYRAPYLEEILDSIGLDHPCRRVVVMKGSQLGLTTAGENVIGHTIDQHPSPILIVQSSEELQRRWADTRLAALVASTPSLRSKVGRQGDLIASSGARGPQSSRIKSFPGGYLVVGNARSKSSLAQLTARLIILDEVDRYPHDLGGEGSPSEIAERRASTFGETAKTYVISSPTVEGHSEIEAEFLESDQRYYDVPCPHCGTMQVLDWEQVVWSRVDRPPEQAAYQCIACEELIEDHQRAAMIREGVWIPRNPGHPTRGYHISSLYSTIGITLGMLAAEFVRATSKGAKALQVFINTRLGQVWAERDIGRTDEDTLLGRRHAWWQPKDDTGPGVPIGVMMLTASVDVQAAPARLELEVVGWGPGEEHWSIDHRVIHGDIAGDPVWDDLAGYLRRSFPCEGGGEMRIAATCVDTGHLAVRVYRFVREQSAQLRVFAIKGKSAARANTQRPIWPKTATKISAKMGGGSLHVLNVDAAKDMVYAWLGVEQHGPGYPHHDMRWDEAAFAQLTAEYRKTVLVNGFPVRVWHKPKGRANERLDLRVYALAALHAIYSFGLRIESFAATSPASAVDGATPPAQRRTGRLGTRRKLGGRRRLARR